MRISPARRLLTISVAATLVAVGSWPGHAEPTASPRPVVAASEARLVPPEVVAATLDAAGRVVRREDGVVVERVPVPSALRGALPGERETVLRVTVRGKFPPRALRYVVFAGHRAVGYGVPTPTGRAVRSITTDGAVLHLPISTSYGDRPALGASGALPPGQTAPDGSNDLAGIRSLEDPGEFGPLAVTRDEYDLGDEVFQPSEIGAKVELIGDVHYPSGLSGGPYPLVLFMHGNHSTCYKGRRAGYQWPCRPGWRALPNYEGYDYLARRLASHGFVVVSVSANGVNVHGNRVDDTGMRQRGEVLEKHIDLWNEWSTTGGDPFETTFVGKIDMTRIGTMGHSRGGEGVVWNVIVDRERPDPYGIDAVLALAPVDFTRVTINEIPFAVVLPYCDGDVSDLQGIHFFDDSRYVVPGDPSAKHTVTAFGANHNFFNTVWSPSSGYPGAFDDGRWTGCVDRLREVEQRRVGSAYIVGFFRRYIGGETALDPMWTGEVQPASIAPARTLVSYLAPDLPDRRLDVARFTDPGDLAFGETGGAVTANGTSMFGWCQDDGDVPCMTAQFGFYDVHLSYSWFGVEAPGLGQAIVGAIGDASVRFDLPGGRDVSSFDAFGFRASVNPGYTASRRIRFQDLVVVLEDADGDTAEVIASDVGNDALAYPLHRRRGGHIILNQLRFPLERFLGIDLTDVVAVELEFGSPPGVMDIADLAFSADEI